MKLLNQLTISNLKLNKRRSLMTILAITLSVALVFTIISMVFSLRNSIEKIVIQENGKYHIKVSEAKDISSKIWEQETSGNIKDLSVVYNLGYGKFDSKNDYKPYLKVTGLNDLDFENHGIELVEGLLPKNHSEIVLSEHVKHSSKNKFEIGDTITLNVGDRSFEDINDTELLNNSKDSFIEGEKLVNTTEMSFTIVGFVRRPNYIFENFSDPGHSVFTLINEKNYESEITVFYNLTNPKDLYKHLEMYENQNLVTVNTQLLESKGIDVSDARMSMIYALAAILIVVIITTSVFIIRNSFSISIIERTKQFGILKSLGASDRQIKANIMYEGLVLGNVGIIFGLIVGLLASSILIVIVDKLIGSSVNFIKFDLVTPFFAYVSSALLGLITIYLSAIKIAKRSVNLSPIEAIRSNADIKVDPKEVKTPKYVDKFFGIGGLISYKNLLRNKKKYKTTIASLALSVAVFIGMNSFVQSLVTASRASYANFNFQITHNFYSEDKEVRDHFENSKVFMKSIIDNEKYTISKGTNVLVNASSINKDYLEAINFESYSDQSNYYANIYEIDNDSFENLLTENNLSDGDFLVINKITNTRDDKTKVFKIFESNNISITAIRDENNENPIQENIALTFIEKPITGMFEYNMNGGISIYAREGSLTNFKFSSSEIFIDSENPAQTYEKIEKKLEELSSHDFSFTNLYEGVKMINNLLLLIQIFGYGFIIVITLIGITNIFNTITSNIQSRRREFASLISYGMSSKQIRNMTLFESMLIGFKGLIFGIPIGIVISVISNIAIGQNVELPYQFPIVAIIISIFTVVLITNIIMNYSMAQIKKQNIIETIRNENI